MRFGCFITRQPQDSSFMRRLVTGVDNQGRSCVVTDVAVEFAVREDRGVVAVEQLYVTDGLPPRLHAVGKADRFDTLCTASITRGGLAKMDARCASR